ncbi:undecaprenyl-diphosphate phosphatase [Terracoccus luteus]|uniref:Undecaprenyl-diphosphatase n=1 Tax=Terracoccus luteus TaxID=53356 RepID=A0A495XY30_9MICO|nr:undecaprenyl-diphosphate phosphatase [Terracoccus luteus]MBB2987677.1 undecaprenyl-diphosphatase [Terracoccus luteus]MCP2173328.1 undecaprenyl-diphosphatase [Terracoccus luteus]RKT78065.1 undecaprenyl-diphosphatase [Terracoccus luteus]
MADLSYLDSVILGVVEGLTEYLPVSSTGHLTITEKLLGLEVNDPAVTAYTAVIQLGAIAATLLFFHKDIIRFARAWFRGLANADARRDPDYGLAWAVVIGSIPVGIVGFALRGLISGGLRSLWVVAAALLLWSVVMVVSERVYARHEKAGTTRGEHSVTPVDGVVIGLVQCFSLIPGVSRSGATISMGIARGIDRLTATRLSFFLAIPALTAAGLFQAVDERDNLVTFGVGPVLVGIVVAFVVAYASIAWLLRFVASNSLLPFVWYRVALGVVLAGVLAAGLISAT